jgi:glycerol-3-phosphate acyltransferase PlsX
MSEMLTLAVDVESGDCERALFIKAVLRAVSNFNHPVKVIFCGEEPQIKKALNNMGALSESAQVKIEHSSDIIEPTDRSSSVWKNRPNSSVVRAVALQKEGVAQVTLSAGDTRVLMSSALFLLGLQNKIQRPALALFLPTAQKREMLFLDVGANLDCKADQLVDFGLLGFEHFAKQFAKDIPSVALLNVGVESNKGTKAVLAASEILSQKCEGYVGFIEGNQVLSGNVDVVVCDGFIGNILLKSFENFYSLAVLATEKNPELLSGLIDNMTILNRDSYGAAPLLGLNGTVYKAHGASSAKAIENATEVALRAGLAANK